MASFSVEVKKFCDEHKVLSILTLGTAVVVYAIGNLCGRAITHIKNCFGTSKKTHELRKKIVNQPNPASSSVVLKSVTTEIDPFIKKQSETIDQIRATEKEKTKSLEEQKSSPALATVKAPEKKALSKEVIDMWQEIEKQTKDIAFEFADAIIFNRSKPDIERQNPEQVLSRFQDVKCPKETVVKVDGTYLHANHIQTKENSIQFVASQAPLPADQALFWKAAASGGYAILDLTKGKEVEEYCPQRLGMIRRGDLTITGTLPLIEQGQMPQGLSLYNYRIIDAKSDEIKEVRRLNFNAWPDHGVVSVDQLKNILSALEDKLGKKVIVHCRAGVGRTGTVIAAQIIKEKIARKEITKANLNQVLISLVVELRKSRGDLFVQTPEQLGLLKEFAEPLLVD